MRFEDISRKVKKFSKDTVEEVQKMNEVRILNGRLNDTKKQIVNIYTEIGKRIYEQYKEEGLSGFETELQSITEKLGMIETLQQQIRDVKGVVICPCCNMEISADERFCSNCGTKMPEFDAAEYTVDPAEETEEETAEETAAEIVGQEAEQAAETAAEPAEEEAPEAAETAAEAAEAEVKAAEETEDAAEKEAETVAEAGQEAAEAAMEAAEKAAEEF